MKSARVSRLAVFGISFCTLCVLWPAMAFSAPTKSLKVTKCVAVPTAASKVVKAFKAQACTTRINGKLGDTEYRITWKGSKTPDRVKLSAAVGPCATKIVFAGFGEDSRSFRLNGCTTTDGAPLECPGFIIDQPDLGYCDEDGAASPTAPTTTTTFATRIATTSTTATAPTTTFPAPRNGVVGRGTEPVTAAQIAYAIDLNKLNNGAPPVVELNGETWYVSRIFNGGGAKYVGVGGWCIFRAGNFLIPPAKCASVDLQIEDWIRSPQTAAVPLPATTTTTASVLVVNPAINGPAPAVSTVPPTITINVVNPTPVVTAAPVVVTPATTSGLKITVQSVVVGNEVTPGFTYLLAIACANPLGQGGAFTPLSFGLRGGESKAFSTAEFPGLISTTKCEVWETNSGRANAISYSSTNGSSAPLPGVNSSSGRFQSNLTGMNETVTVTHRFELVSSVAVRAVVNVSPILLVSFSDPSNSVREILLDDSGRWGATLRLRPTNGATLMTFPIILSTTPPGTIIQFRPSIQFAYRDNSFSQPYESSTLCTWIAGPNGSIACN
jgi:hypothetical protein